MTSLSTDNTSTEAVVTVDGPEFSWSAASDVLRHSLDRGDFDDDTVFEQVAATAMSLFDTEWESADGSTIHTVSMSVGDFEGIVDVLGYDRAATTVLRPVIAAINAALDTATV